MAEGEPQETIPSPGNDSRFMKLAEPKKGVRYPIQVIYVDVCDGWPLEYCEYHPNHEKAKIWMEENLTDDMKALYLEADDDDDDGADGGEKKKRQTRGGKGQVKPKKKETSPKGISISRASRGKKKYTTVVTGLATYDIDLKTASRAFGSKFACGASVTGEDEIVITGDVKDDLFDFIPEKWPDISEDDIEDLGDLKR